MKVGFVGLGYVGLTTAVCMAVKGFRVVGVDVDEEKVVSIRKGELPFREPGAEKLLKRAVRGKNFKCTTEHRELTGSDVVFLTVGTPSREDGSIDLRYVAEAAGAVGEVLAKSGKKQAIAVKSTVVPGTTRTVVRERLEEKSGKKVGKGFLLAANPEFLREGSAVQDTLKPDRIVVGDDWGGADKALLILYRRFYGVRMPPVIKTNTVNAEMIKYASNTFLAARISLINDIANICQRVPGADVVVVARGIGLDRRIGPYFLNAGLGYGGSCFPKDVKALIAFAQNLGYKPAVPESVEKVNTSQPYRAVELAEDLVGSLAGKKAAILGLSFKPNTDDVREAVSLKIIDRLLESGCSVSVYDPAAMKNVQRIYGDKIRYASSPVGCLRDADLCI
ncbi:MAG: UDP-glucose/GDP-mannose dehydrogenase family protein, partial [Candidatus Caldarchaeum sp.]|nr:UDP-glucose/GDP-mannose dehydrogenase family protein [Candidatus Caldarchaeum sp.]MDW8360292.1 UDP-glucose/GDP-mannose dehydrogenase family protein [Candidatus Caldarchaeum sp.]